jgi:hypothetical protein
MENQLIQLYLLVCQIYDSQSCLKSQRASNFKPRFTDQELITVYLFGHFQGLYQKKAIYRFVQNYWAAWFPDLPSYQAFNRRLNLLEETFHAFRRQGILRPGFETRVQTAEHASSDTEKEAERQRT